jgi:glycerol uptake facilitator-like aquaporin
MWYLSKRDGKPGNESIQQYLWLLLPPALVAVSMWYGSQFHLPDGYRRFIAALIGEGIGALIVLGLYQGIWRGVWMDKTSRVLSVGFSLGLAGFMFFFLFR